MVVMVPAMSLSHNITKEVRNCLMKWSDKYMYDAYNILLRNRAISVYMELQVQLLLQHKTMTTFLTVYHMKQ